VIIEADPALVAVNGGEELDAAREELLHPFLRVLQKHASGVLYNHPEVAVSRDPLHIVGGSYISGASMGILITAEAMLKKREKSDESYMFNVFFFADTAERLIKASSQNSPFHSINEFKEADMETGGVFIADEHKVDCNVILGTRTLTIAEIAGLEEDAVLELRETAGAPVTLADKTGRRIAKGEVVVVDDYFGVRIVEMLS
jgi:flagellar motor switch/type III secretory pathway protein FliN